MSSASMAAGTLKKLEFHKIKEKLAQYTVSPMGREKVELLYPLTAIDQINSLLKETSEATELLRLEAEIPLPNLKDIRLLLLKLDKGSVLEPEEVLAVAGILSASRRLKKFILDRKDKYPLLSEISTDLIANQTLEEQINQVLLDTGEISDTASPELRAIRRQIKSLNEGIKDRLDQILRSTQTQKYLQENLVTVRGDRYVVPVKQEYRQQFPGIVHDQSASGATIYVEPMAIVEKNNELRRLKSQEKQEIIRILTYLSGQIWQEAAYISDSVRALGHLDFILAKGRLSQALNCGAPVLNNQGYLNLKQARHPLITGKVVPIDIHLGKTFDIMVITGPNTGGKTVTLKTAGLLTLMAQAGLHIPTETGSEVAVFQKIYADIGDEQSIEQSLSTFSSHMTNIINILNDIDSDSLVLLDELGAGTDPAEGAALAMAILDYLHHSKAKTIATTHYSELKTFAFEQDRVENASVEFDIATLKPTYRLNIGQPGHSSAFDIARGLGLNMRVIDKAKNYMSHEQLKVADLIQELETNRRAAEKEYAEARQQKTELAGAVAKYERLLQDIDKKKTEVLDKAKVKAGEITGKAKLQAEEIIAELKQAQESVNLQAAQKARNKIRSLQGAIAADVVSSKPMGQQLSKVQLGQTVYVPKLDQEATVQSLPDSNGEVQVMVGILKTNVLLKELRSTETINSSSKPVVKNNYSGLMGSKTMNIKKDIDLRGLMVEEALEQVDKYLDDATLAGLPQVCLIHGKGTGALRAAITDYLKYNGHVQSFRAGLYGEGGIGVTIVEIK